MESTKQVRQEDFTGMATLFHLFHAPSEEDVRSMLSEIRAERIFDDVSGAPPVEKDPLMRLMLGISDLCTTFRDRRGRSQSGARLSPRGGHSQYPHPARSRTLA
jgi:hypothetical protein